MALEHLHAHGLVHRDIKPSNIIFVGGVPKLADIGLVASMDATMSFVGTSGFLPPEGPGTPQGDLYSLGKVLYEISMGRDRQEFPKLPADLLVAASRESTAGPVLPEAQGGLKSAALARDAVTAMLELNAVILKACHSDPRQRYQSAQEMASDLALLQGGQSVKQKRERQRFWTICKKAGLAAVLVVLAAIIASRFTGRGADDYVESTNPEVNSLVDRGNLAIRGETPERVRYALECFKKAVELDPNFVPAHFGLAGAYIHLLDDSRMASLRVTAQDLMKLDPFSAEALHIDAFVKWRDGKYGEALAEAKRATQSHAVCKEGRAWAYVAHAFFLQNTGDADAALAQYRLAEKLYPAEPTIQDHLGHPYFMRSNLVEAQKHYQKSLELQPNHVNGIYWLGRTYEDMEKFDKAIREFEKLDRLYERNEADTKRFYDGLRAAVQEGGAAGYWQKRLDEALKEPSPDLYYIASMYAHRGEMDKAYEYLEKAFERHYCLEHLLFDLCWDRNDEWFKSFARRIGLMQ